MRGFTLVELLAVLVLSGLTVSVGLVRLGSLAETERLSRVEGDWIALDQRTRLEARRAGGSVLPVMTLLDGVEVHVDAPRGVLDFDGAGRSDDYGVHVLAAGRTRSWRVWGVTGWVER